MKTLPSLALIGSLAVSSSVVAGTCNDLLKESVLEFRSMGVAVDFYECPRTFIDSLYLSNKLSNYENRLFKITSDYSGYDEAIRVHNLIRCLRGVGHMNGFTVRLYCDYNTYCPTAGYRESQSKKKRNS